eukprot:15480628-Alexandrium_andersonii.AAC.1
MPTPLPLAGQAVPAGSSWRAAGLRKMQARTVATQCWWCSRHDASQPLTSPPRQTFRYISARP